MIAVEGDYQGPRGVAVVDIGNSTTKVGLWGRGAVSDSRSSHHSESAFEEAWAAVRQIDEAAARTVAIGSVVPDRTLQVVEWVERHGGRALVVGEEIPLPIPLRVEEPEQVGIDRICQAAAAHERTGHACTVIAFGTAITVDLVGDDGVFMGGAILPGLRMQAEALHKHTAQLPLVKLQLPPSLLGQSTEQAIQNGIIYGAVGAVRSLVERYASALGTWPQVVATGGDLGLVASELDFVDSMVADLCLMGVGLAWARHRGIVGGVEEP